MQPDPHSALDHSVEAGRPDSPLLLCVHGQGGSTVDWSERVRRIAARGLHAVAIELPLHGADASTVSTQAGRWTCSTTCVSSTPPPTNSARSSQP